jgi:APA family basic amino acid/polyamine antiporter
MTYAGITLNVFTFLTVASVFIHRRKFPQSPRPYKTWGYPVIPIVYLAIISLTLGFLLFTNTFESLLGLLTIGIGYVIYLLTGKKTIREKEHSK